LASRLGVRFVELDAVFHQADWTQLPDEEFRARAAEVVAADAWVIDGNYAVVRPLVLQQATTVAWLDYSRSRVMTRVIRRSLARVVTREELWNGNRERLRSWVDPEHPIPWSWSHYHRKRVEYASRFAEPQHRHLDVRRFRTPRDAREWLAHAG